MADKPKIGKNQWLPMLQMGHRVEYLVRSEVRREVWDPTDETWRNLKGRVERYVTTPIGMEAGGQVRNLVRSTIFSRAMENR